MLGDIAKLIRLLCQKLNLHQLLFACHFTGRITKPGNPLSLKPHVIMSNMEKFIYEDNNKEANAQRTRFFKQIKFQSSPSAEDLDKLVGMITQNKNPVRATLFHTAAAFQHIQDNARVGNRSYTVSGYVYEIFNLVSKLTCDRKSSQEVLDFNHLKKGAQAKGIAKFLVPFMQKLYDVGCADDNEDETSSRKAYALRWTAAALHKVEEYRKVIELLEKCSAHYGGVQNESEVNIRQTLGLCYEKKKRFDDALRQMTEALILAQTVEMKDKEKTIKYLEIYIARIQKSKASAGRVPRG